MISKEEIEDSIEYKYDNYYDEDTYRLTKEEAEYILMKENYFSDDTERAAAKALIKYVEQLESNNYEQNNIINNYIEERRELAEKLEEIRNNLEKDDFVGYADDIQEILEGLKGEEK